MSVIVFSIQSLNNIWMMSNRKCSIGIIRWCFFFKPRSLIFPCRRRLKFFSISIGESCIWFCRGWLMFSLPSKWKHAGVGRNTTSVELKRKNLAVYIVNFYGNICKKPSSTVKKYYRPAFVKTIAQCWLKISVEVLQWPMSAIVFSFQSLNNIWMMSIRKCSIGVIRWCFRFKPRSLNFRGRRRLAFFLSVSVNQGFFEVG